ncbi:DUF1439 domain-containing protein [Bacterioplanoides pacificum]|uniref:DUF1439 domain-containing protein n=1 Tax=Bacterioplanoides pacificum TaxID=1171596 RepID=A0ABV7VUH4_9GAMM
MNTLPTSRPVLQQLLLITLLAVSNLSWGFSYTLEITGQQIQQKVDTLMPLQKKKLFFTVTLSNARVELTEGQQPISLFSEITLEAPNNIRATGRATISGNLSYNAQQGAFYLHNPVIRQLEIDQLDPGLLPTVKQLAQNAASQTLAKRPVYQLDDQDLKQKLAKTMLKSIRVENQLIKAELSAF